MDESLIGYLLDALDPGERAAIDARLHVDAGVRTRLERLRTAMAPLESDRAVGDPPIGLADRTMARLNAIGYPPREIAASPSRWRRLDVAIAAGIMLMIAGLTTSGVVKWRHSEAVLACQNNLREYHAALNGFAFNHGNQYPHVNDAPPYNRAGAVYNLLRESGTLPGSGTLLCPSKPEAAVYSYTLGYRDLGGQLKGLCIGEFVQTPIMSDRESPVGHYNGHNVLYVDGSVRFTTTPNVGPGGDNIFLNQAQQRAAGLNRMDSVLAVGDIAP